MWTIEDSKLIYGIGRGDLDFLDINSDGKLQLIVEGLRINIEDVIKKIKPEFGEDFSFQTPSFTLRIPQLITSQINKVKELFHSKMKEFNYPNQFQPLFPIKVNQRKSEIKMVIQSSESYGLEAGTRAEMLILLKEFRIDKTRTIACNGVKGPDYIELIREATIDGYNILVSIESMNELNACLKRIPLDKLKLIFRIKPYVSVSGHWGSTSGRDSKFGLSIADLIQITKFLKERDLTHLLLGIHAHPGSQMIENVGLHNYIQFMIDTYAQLFENGFKEINILNFGGGLPIDYDNSLSNDFFESYVEFIVEGINAKITKLRERNSQINFPIIMIEAGRAITALSAMTFVRPLEYHHLFPRFDKDLSESLEIQEFRTIGEIFNYWNMIKSTNLLDKTLEELHEHEAKLGKTKILLREKIQDTFNYDQLSEKHKTMLFDIMKPNVFILGNFSVFNSVCDHVMVNQYFPCFTIDGLDEQPATLSRLVDITCDSDGEMSAYRTKQSSKRLFTKDGIPLTASQIIQWKGFPINNFDDINNRHIAIPLVGAYQDIIELNHNLIGDLTDVTIWVNKDDWSISISNKAQSIQDILKEVGYHLEISDHSYVN